MSHIDELITVHCPDGVPYLAIGSADVSEKVVAGATPKTGRSEFWDGGTIPWMSSGEVNKGTVHETDQFITQTAYDSTSTKLVPAGTVVMALAGQGKTRGTVARTRIELCTNQSLASIVVAKGMSSDFLYYYLQTQYQKLRDVSSGEGTRGGLNLQMIKAYKVPVPPFEVQRAIVEVLDTFSKLEAELEAELEARKQQYEHYRQRVFTLDSSTTRVPLGEIVEVRSGWGFPNAYQGEPDGVIPFYKVSDMNLLGNETSMSRANNYVTEEVAKKLGARPAPAGSTIFPKIGAAVATNKKRILSRTAAYDNNVMGLVPGERILPRFLFHWMQTFNLSKLANDSGAVPSIRKSEAEQVLVPLPNKEEQERIVSILDKFDALVNDLSVGLPAELAARRRQYEYYRDKLLTFTELEAAA